MIKPSECGTLKTGAPIGVPVEGRDAIISLAFSPDGGKIASGCTDRTIRLWSTATRALIGKPMTGHSDWVRSVTFSHDGAFIVSGSDDNTIRVWDTETGTEICEPLRDHTGLVRSVSCSSDGVCIVSGSNDGSVRLWNIADILAKGPIGQAHGSSPKFNALSFDDTPIGTPSAEGNGATSHLCRDITTQYPAHLFPLQTFNIKDGWIVGPNDKLLLWVPPANHPGLQSPASKNCVMGVTQITELDFRNFCCGTEWMRCREPVNTEYQ